MEEPIRLSRKAGFIIFSNVGIFLVPAVLPRICPRPPPFTSPTWFDQTPVRLAFLAMILLALFNFVFSLTSLGGPRGSNLLSFGLAGFSLVTLFLAPGLLAMQGVFI